MAGARGRGTVTCPACGREVDRREAREYDKDAHPWALRGVRYEQLCPACYGDLDHRPRDGLEETLVRINAGGCDRSTFLRRYHAATAGRSGGGEE